MKISNLKPIFATILLIAYLAVLLKLLVFKYPGVHFDPEYNFIPFKTIIPYLIGYPNWIVARNNLLGNIVTFMPLGFLAPFLYARFTWKHALAAGFVLSLAIEILQIVLHAGTFDVDDILLNMLGTLLGYSVFVASISIVLFLKKKTFPIRWDFPTSISMQI